MSESREPAVSVAGASVDYGDVRAVADVSLEVEAGAVHVLLGRSGSGKTTLLRAIAGFEPISSGRIVVDGRTVDDGSRGGWVAPELRRIGFVFQDYALFTHLDAAGNIGFGAPGSRDERRKTASEWLARVDLASHGDRKPGELSGGEQQRVALARALAQGPALVLLDEPFSNLDPHLRRQVRDDTIALLRENGATAIFVTHDVEEAFSVGDRISVLDGGRVAQTGAPHEIYTRPATRHVASLCGQAAFIPIDSIATGEAVCALGEVEVIGEAAVGDCLVVRPEHVVVSAGEGAAIVRRRFLGPVEELELTIGDLRIVARVAPGSIAKSATEVAVTVVEQLAVVPRR